ncbi:GAF domain-containing hybrid sensor histidine kinase/response regulator [Fimbriimonas ginsengisoli]|uniref:Circadian input-output histidine kinase CikA n=1 Tax=Fimbriimonas ginsengisoli Gsoil 348 TaxID=661478 RepID=A0A068NST2_FIMGI|nr:GAF domain-containing hybrid sensor histidine kinase/response regulator [Fimbriimonas ginsengisoli]AIE86417.1 Response regulator receiver [Fimbriimonas ginsengisoli Gsoil 348]
MSARLPDNERERLAALREYGVLDTPRELAYDDLVKLAASICRVPIAAMTFVDEDRQWFKARIGLDAEQTSRSQSFCAHAILDPASVMEVEDAAVDDRFRTNELVVGSPGIRFYAGAPLLTDDGLALGALCVIDVKPRHLSEEQIEALKALGRQVMALLDLRKSMSHLQIGAVELREALLAAESSHRAKEVFLSNMSHELRTPLNGLIGMADLLSATPLNARQTRYVETMRASGAQLLEVLTGVLQISESGAIEADLVEIPTELPLLARDVVELMRPAAVAKGLALSMTVDAPLHAPVLADQNCLRQVLTNLLGNALKFTEHGSVELRMRHLKTADSTIRVRLEIEDTGIGIPTDRLDAIFDHFVQADDRLSRAYGGSGLGLSISRGIVMRMGGNLSVSSAVGKGSVFSFELDMNLVPQATNLRPCRVLVVEDNEVNTIVITAMLEHKGCVVSHVANGLEAVQILKRERFDMVFMDLQMPVMDGVTATREVRATEPGTEHVPIVAVTASAMEEDEQICRQAGMDGLIRKPISERLIAEALERFVLR